MDGNKVDALKCLKIGKDALEAGDRRRALKFIRKARRLDPTLSLDDLISKVQGEQDNGSNQDHVNNDAASDAADANTAKERPLSSFIKLIRKAFLSCYGFINRAYFRFINRGAYFHFIKLNNAATFTKEQITIVREINKKKCYYEILGLEKSCSVGDVRKAYKKLSLKVHPDKNSAPGAEEAFKAVSTAYQCLSKEESRRQYDRTAAGFSCRSGKAGRAADHGSAGSDDERRRVALLALLLFIIIIILLWAFLPSSERIYSFSRTYPYEYMFTTQRGVNYYVNSTVSTAFGQDYPFNGQERMSLEGEIETEYLNILHRKCISAIKEGVSGYFWQNRDCEMLMKFKCMA